MEHENLVLVVGAYSAADATAAPRCDMLLAPFCSRADL
jgi:hypothetical protein